MRVHRCPFCRVPSMLKPSSHLKFTPGDAACVAGSSECNVHDIRHAQISRHPPVCGGGMPNTTYTDGTDARAPTAGRFSACVAPSSHLEFTMCSVGQHARGRRTHSCTRCCRRRPGTSTCQASPLGSVSQHVRSRPRRTDCVPWSRSWGHPAVCRGARRLERAFGRPPLGGNGTAFRCAVSLVLPFMFAAVLAAVECSSRVELPR